MPPKNRSTGLGRSRNSPPAPPDRLKTAQMVADAIEMAPKLAIPLEVRVGARLQNHPNDLGQPAIVTVLNVEDGHEYEILVRVKP